VDPDFREKAPAKLWGLAEEKHSRLILALDLYSNNSTQPQEVMNRSISLLESLKDLLAGVKIGLPLSLTLGFERIAELLDTFKQDFYMIADFKLSDIPDINQIALNFFSKLGFDAAIAHLFQGGLRNLRRRSIDLFGVVVMSHPDSRLLQENFQRLIEEASIADVDGVVVGATKESFIRAARKALPEKTILSPGVVVQGARPGSALEYGGDFEIVGRAITRSPDPLSSARKIVEAERDVLSR